MESVPLASTPVELTLRETIASNACVAELVMGNPGYSEHAPLESVNPAETAINTAIGQTFGTGVEGNAGRLVIPEFEFAVPLYYDWSGDIQVICDANDSALYVTCGTTPVIGDHKNQGFDVIKSCYEGMLCYIEQNGEYTRYECVFVDPDGYNDSWDLWTGGQSALFFGPEYMACYTCNQDWMHVTIVMWKQTE